MRALIKDRRGVVMLEFALCAPVLVALLLGGLDLGLAQFDRQQLEFAAQAAAECWAKGACANASAASSYAADRLGEASIVGAAVTSSADTCGHRVSIAWAFKPVGFVFPAIPLAATACTS